MSALICQGLLLQHQVKTSIYITSIEVQGTPVITTNS